MGTHTVLNIGIQGEQTWLQSRPGCKSFLNQKEKSCDEKGIMRSLFILQ